MAKDATATVEKRNLALARIVARVCDEKRAEDILLLDLRRVCDFADFFVIATAVSGPQMKAIARDTEKSMKTERASLLARDGLDSGKWVLLDYGDVVVHLFSPQTREFYQLEHLWGDAERVEWEE